MVQDCLIWSKGLTKKFGDFVAVRPLDICIQRQECFGFLGPNGAGKTSTMKMIYCASPVTGGDLFVAGLDVKRQAREVKANIGVVPQDDNLDPDLSVLKNLLVYARYFDIPAAIAKKRAIEALELMQLEDRANSRISQLSGGMQRRLVIARALINDPTILILDEPTTGLDPQARHLVWQKLRHLKSQGVTLVLTTHYMEEAEQLCDRLVIMDNGAVLASGAPRQLIDTYVGRDVLELRLSSENKAMVLHDLAAQGCRVEDTGDSVHVYSSDGRRLEKLLDVLSVQPESYLYRRAGLEDVFLKLAGRELKE